LKALQLTGKVVVPSFTFCATVHAIKWAGLEPVFADIDPQTFNITPETISRVLTPEVSAIMPVHVFGMPCDIDGICRLAEERSLKIVWDSAQAIGSTYQDKPLGSFGDAESFSTHATKVVPAGEGGLVTTNNDQFAETLRSMRAFGVHGDVDCSFIGLNAKMAEIPAILAIEGFKSLESSISHRRTLVNIYREQLSQVPGTTFQAEPEGAVSNYQNFAVVIDCDEFGIARDDLFRALKAENIIARKYFFPPIHSTTAYADTFEEADAGLPTTNHISDRVICLPLYSDMPATFVERVCAAISDIQAFAPALQRDPRLNVAPSAFGRFAPGISSSAQQS
jgi:dTDP-4-amino-4,6-dideoxygalactose transaminase